MTLAKDIGNIVGKSEQSVKFHAARMMLEVLAERKLSVPEQKLIYSRAKYWRPID